MLCDSVVVQFLSVAGQKQLGPTSRIDTADIVSIPDILAMKLNAVTGRAKLRDYFDLMVIDQQTGYPIEQGLAFFLERYNPQVPEQSATVVIRSLAYLDDVVEDETVPVDRQVVVDFWRRRSVEMAQYLDRNGGSDVRPDSNQGHEPHPGVRKGKGCGP